jgi:hypothetical protein
MKQAYQAPKIVDERHCEAQAMACNKVPGLGDPNFCGQVFCGRVDHHDGCSVNLESRSS